MGEKSSWRWKSLRGTFGHANRGRSTKGGYTVAAAVGATMGATGYKITNKRTNRSATATGEE